MVPTANQAPRFPVSAEPGAAEQAAELPPAGNSD
jgi:hypothetical protein